jgi:predicted amidohydrolase
MLVCFDHFFPEAARSLALRGARIICHPSNLVLEYAQTNSITRAVENRVFWILANRTGSETLGEKTLAFNGRSQIVTPDGCSAAPARIPTNLSSSMLTQPRRWTRKSPPATTSSSTVVPTSTRSRNLAVCGAA